MCFKVKEEFKTRQQAREYQPKVATKNIRVWKWLEHEYRTPDKWMLEQVSNTTRLISPYMYMEYKHGETYTSKLGKKIERWSSYSPWKIEINRGLHAYTYNREPLFGYHVYEMYVPKGSLYYTDGKEIVATALVFKQLRKR